MKELTNKTWGMQTRSFGTIWLTQEQAELAIAAYKSGTEYIEMEDLLVSKGDIAGFAKGEKLKEVERKRQGEWFCEKHNNWIQKGKSCGYCGQSTYK